MAADFNKPVVGDQYALVLQYLRENAAALAVMLNPSAAAASGAANVPTDAIRYNGTSSKFEKWSGSAWNDLSLGYLLTTGGTITGNTTFSPGVSALFAGGGGSGNGISSGNGDNSSQTANNLKISSWYGVGFAPSISGQPVPLGEYSHWFNTRTGDFGMRGALTVGGGLYVDVGPTNRYAGSFTADANRYFGKVLQVATWAGTGGDGPQIHFLHAGVCEWGFGIEPSNGSGLAMYAGGNAALLGTMRFRFGKDGVMALHGDTYNQIQFVVGGAGRTLYHDSARQMGFLNSSGGWALRNADNGDTFTTGGLSIGGGTLIPKITISNTAPGTLAANELWFQF